MALYLDAQNNPTTNLSNPAMAVDNANASGKAVPLYLDELGGITTLPTPNPLYAPTDDNAAPLVYYDADGLEVITADRPTVPHAQDDKAAYDLTRNRPATIEVVRQQLALATVPFELVHEVDDNGTDTLNINVTSRLIDPAGARATASSSMLSPSAVIDGNRMAGLLWRDNTDKDFSDDWVQINYPAVHAINSVAVYSVQDGMMANHQVEPDDTMTFGAAEWRFASRGVTAFTVQGLKPGGHVDNVGDWVTLGQVSGNNLVKRTVSFDPFMTDTIRVKVTGGANKDYSWIVEVEAYATMDATLTVTGGTLSGSHTALKISTGAGADEVSLDGLTTGAATIHTGAGDDVVNIADCTAASLVVGAGSGDDTVNLGEILGGAVSIYGDAGNDTFNVGPAAASLGGGTPGGTGASLHLYGGSSAADASAGADQIVFGYTDTAGQDAFNPSIYAAAVADPGSGTPIAWGIESSDASAKTFELTGAATAGRIWTVNVGGTNYSYMATADDHTLHDVATHFAASVTGACTAVAGSNAANANTITFKAKTGNLPVATATSDAAVTASYDPAGSQALRLTSAPVVGQLYTLALKAAGAAGYSYYYYTAVAGDTASTILHGLADQVPTGVPGYTARVSGSTLCLAKNNGTSFSMSLDQGAYANIQRNDVWDFYYGGQETAMLSGTPTVGRTWTVAIGGTKYSYTATESDRTLANVAAKLAVVASANNNNLGVTTEGGASIYFDSKRVHWAFGDYYPRLPAITLNTTAVTATPVLAHVALLTGVPVPGHTYALAVTAGGTTTLTYYQAASGDTAATLLNGLAAQLPTGNTGYSATVDSVINALTVVSNNSTPFTLSLDQGTFAAEELALGAYGMLRLNGNVYTYTPDATAIEALSAGDFKTDTFTLPMRVGASSTTQTLTVNVSGADDLTVIGGEAAGHVTEDAVVRVSGMLTIDDADPGEAEFRPETVVGAFGTFSLTANGAWSYVLKNEHVGVQKLNTGDVVEDVFTAYAVDGTAAVLKFSVHGTTDYPLETSAMTIGAVTATQRYEPAGVKPAMTFAVTGVGVAGAPHAGSVTQHFQQPSGSGEISVGTAGGYRPPVVTPLTLGHTAFFKVAAGMPPAGTGAGAPAFARITVLGSSTSYTALEQWESGRTPDEGTLEEGTPKSSGAAATPPFAGLATPVALRGQTKPTGASRQPDAAGDAAFVAAPPPAEPEPLPVASAEARPPAATQPLAFDDMLGGAMLAAVMKGPTSARIDWGDRRATDRVRPAQPAATRRKVEWSQDIGSARG